MKRSFSMICALGLLLAAPAWAGVAGDCDGDGQVTAADVQIASDLVNTSADDADFNAAADVDGDGMISFADVSAIQRAAD